MAEEQRKKYDKVKNNYEKLIGIAEKNESYKEYVDPLQDLLEKIDIVMRAAFSLDNKELQDKCINYAAKNLEFFKALQGFSIDKQIKEVVYCKNLWTRGLEELKKQGIQVKKEPELLQNVFGRQRKTDLIQKLMQLIQKTEESLKKAAIKIQAAYRGKRVREDQETKKKAAAKIQELNRERHKESFKPVLNQLIDEKIQRLKEVDKKIDAMQYKYDKRKVLSDSAKGLKDQELYNNIKSRLTEFSDKDFSGAQKFARVVRNVGKKVERWAEKVKNAAKLATRRSPERGRRGD